MDAKPPVLQPVTASAGPASVFDVEIRLPDGRVGTIAVGRDEFILDAARMAGFALPSLCEQGWCTRCAARIERGEVDQDASMRYYEADRRAGFALLCTARPRSPLRLLSHQHAAMLEHRVASRLPVPQG